MRCMICMCSSVGRSAEYASAELLLKHMVECHPGKFRLRAAGTRESSVRLIRPARAVRGRSSQC